MIKNDNNFILYTLIIILFRFHSLINIFIDMTWYHACSCFTLFFFIVNSKHRSDYFKGTIKIEMMSKCFYYRKNYSYLRSHFFSTDFLHELLIATLLLKITFFFNSFSFTIQEICLFISAAHLIHISKTSQHDFWDTTFTEAWINLFSGWLSTDEKPRFIFLVSPYFSLHREQDVKYGEEKPFVV